jgi:2-polyprenyl-3-methyl-5-hydroxy-6-metoxy-1,4-benzoquinol methylase
MQDMQNSTGHRFLVRLGQGITWRLHLAVQRFQHVRSELSGILHERLGITEPEAKLLSDSQNYWNDPSSSIHAQNSHWRGVGIFADDSRWLELGRQNLAIYSDFARLANAPARLVNIVEWGCGGGINAIQFAPLADRFFGVDISAASLAECERQMSAEGLTNFVPVLIDSDDPEAAIAKVPDGCDLLISTYVFELLPTPEYGFRVLNVVAQILKPGALAMLQVKYSELDWKTQSRRWNYQKNMAWNATYRIEEFWSQSERCGLLPQAVKLVPKQPLVNDRNYAYFLLKKPVPLTLSRP